MMPKISVIVPVYNVRDYLEKCVESVRRQTFRDWELLLVNDGSDDGSGELCRALADCDDRIRVIDRPNGGVSAARSTGLDAAEGEYITFLDSDDSLYPEHLTELLNLCERTDSEAAADGMVLVFTDGTPEREIRLRPGVHTGTKEILKTYLLDSEEIYGGCNKLFRRSLIGQTRFEPYTRAEDALFCVQVLSRCRSYAVTDSVGYRYFRRADSATLRAPDGRSADQVRAWEKIYGILNDCAPELCPYAAGKICHDVDKIPFRADTAGRELKALREKYFPLQFAGKKLPLRKRIAAAVFRVSPRFYYWLNRRNGGVRR